MNSKYIILDSITGVWTFSPIRRLHFFAAIQTRRQKTIPFLNACTHSGYMLTSTKRYQHIWESMSLALILHDYFGVVSTSQPTPANAAATSTCSTDGALSPDDKMSLRFTGGLSSNKRLTSVVGLRFMMMIVLKKNCT